MAEIRVNANLKRFGNWLEEQHHTVDITAKGLCCSEFTLNLSTI